MRILITAIVCAAVFTACNRTKETAKEVINKTGETVGKGATEFVTGMSKGIDKTLESKIELSDKLQSEGLQISRFELRNGNENEADTLTAYVVFNKKFNQTVSVKALNSSGVEYGRSVLALEGAANEARYVDFPFDKRTNFESKSRFVLE